MQTDRLHAMLNAAQLAGADYADARLELRRHESLSYKNARLTAYQDTESIGIGLRVFADGAWGFASTADLSEGAIARTAKLAVEIARAAASSRQKELQLSPVEPHKAQYTSPMAVDPFTLPLEEKLGLLEEIDNRLREVPGIAIAEAFLDFYRTHKYFASTQGAWIEQTITESGGGFQATAIRGDDVQIRSYPTSFRGNLAARGYEFIRELDLPSHALRIAEEAVELLDAPVCPAGEKTVIIAGDQMALQVHESIGHPIELDRVMGTEASFAGTSFLTLEKLNHLQYASPIVNVFADATIPGSIGSFAYDDEGVPAQRTPIIREGRFVGYITSRETAPVIGQMSNGTMRADSWNRLPLIRMTNINLEPGDWRFDDLIADTDDGIFLETNRSWSIDDKRLNFQFATEVAREIKGGKLGRLYKNPVYAGITPDFWNRCDAIGNADHWQIWGVPNCGKGEPCQAAHVAHGTAPARFRNVKIWGV